MVTETKESWWERCLQQLLEEWGTFEGHGSHNSTVNHCHLINVLFLPREGREWSIQLGLLHRDCFTLRSCLDNKLHSTETFYSHGSFYRAHYSDTAFCHVARIVYTLCEPRILWAGINLPHSSLEYEPHQPHIRLAHALPDGILALRHPHANA